MRKTQKSNGGAIGGDYSCDISEKWWYTATCEFITIPGGTTENQRVTHMSNPSLFLPLCDINSTNNG